MVWFNYRRVPAIALAKQMSTKAASAVPSTIRATYLQDWTISPRRPAGRRALWRLDVKRAGSGVTGDLLAHSIDTAMWLNGAITRVSPRPRPSSRKRKHVDRESGAGRHRRRLHVPGGVRQRLDGHFRIHPLRPRPEELQHLRAQWR
jgi:predicted dehydrogenase